MCGQYSNALFYWCILKYQIFVVGGHDRGFCEFFFFHLVLPWTVTYKEVNMTSRRVNRCSTSSWRIYGINSKNQSAIASYPLVIIRFIMIHCSIVYWRLTASLILSDWSRPIKSKNPICIGCFRRKFTIFKFLKKKMVQPAHISKLS